MGCMIEEILPGLVQWMPIVLSNRHHYRYGARCAKRFGCPVLCH
jgi:hypothetical protein